jgi:hypothetical protein
MANLHGTPRNLCAFPTGRSGNPGGRPKGRSITAALRAELDRPCADDPTVTQGERIAERLVGMALGEGGVRPEVQLAAIREVLDRTEGKVVARTDQGDPGEFDELAHLSTEELRRMLRTTT